MVPPEVKSQSFQLFNSIANRYDWINSALSLGLHRSWRRQLCRRIPRKLGLQVLDLATGTAEVALELAKSTRVKHVIGVDLAESMVEQGLQKVAAKNLENKISLEIGDAQALRFEDKSFDLATMAFGIRNVQSVETCLSECYRLIRSGGRLLILEFGLPQSRVVRKAHLCYLRWMLPHIGAYLSGHSSAYRYLDESIEAFPYGQAFCDLIENAGFDSVGFETLSFGTVNLYWGDKH